MSWLTFASRRTNFTFQEPSRFFLQPSWGHKSLQQFQRWETTKTTSTATNQRNPPRRSDVRKQTKLRMVRRGLRFKKGGSPYSYEQQYYDKSKLSFFEPELSLPYEEPPKTQYRKGAISDIPLHIPYRQDLPPPRYGITKDIFLQRIGKGCSEYAEKISSWEELMTIKSRKLKEREIPTKARRWILRWVEKYKQGEEPYSIRFKSKCKKNKEKKKELVDKHKEQFAKHTAKLVKAREQRKKEKRAWQALIHRLDTEKRKAKKQNPTTEKQPHESLGQQTQQF